MDNGLWWKSRALWLTLALVTAIPFLVADVPPLTDLPNHMARYYIFLNIDHSSFLQNIYDVHWRLNGNSGIDIIVRMIGPFLGTEFATRVAVGLIPPLTIAGIYSVSRALNDQVVPSALVALPLFYNWPFYAGFVNFSLSAAMALLVLAFWIRLRARGFATRVLVFAPLAFATCVAHAAGWGLLGLGVLGCELVREYQLCGFKLRSAFRVAVAILPFALPIFFIVFWRSRSSNALDVILLSNIFLPDILWNKFASLGSSIFREAYKLWDMACLLIFFALTIAMYRVGGRRVIVPAAVIGILYLLAFAILPFEIFGAYFADRRLLPYVAIFMPLSVGIAHQVLADERRRRALGFITMAAIVFFTARVAVTTAAWKQANDSFNSHLVLLDRISRHSRVFGLIVEPCGSLWSRVGRLDTLQAFALIRRESLINGLFQQEFGPNEIIEAHDDDSFNRSTVVYSDICPAHYMKETFQTAIARFPREQFGYVWLVSPVPLPAVDLEGLRLISSSGNDRLFQIVQ